MKISRAEQARALAQRELSDAEADYQRFRAAYVKIARDEPGHEVALAMVGADMDRAYARLQRLSQAPTMPFTSEPAFLAERTNSVMVEESA
ncbi:MAG TPA: hypothetical protein VLJ58_15645 [Ramlibacter sp.]|nr:hypothetical protein [Ramlibacter sp.]